MVSTTAAEGIPWQTIWGGLHVFQVEEVWHRGCCLQSRIISCLEVQSISELCLQWLTQCCLPRSSPGVFEAGKVYYRMIDASFCVGATDFEEFGQQLTTLVQLPKRSPEKRRETKLEAGPAEKREGLGRACDSTSLGAAWVAMLDCTSS